MANKNTSIDLSKSIFNDYVITPKNLTQYTAFRGVTDFSQIGQFDQYEDGYQFLVVIQRPRYLEKLGATNTMIKAMYDSFEHMLEYEFRGLDGLPDMTADTLELTDGINTQRMISKVTQETSATVSMNYFERRGGLITKCSNFYLTGLKDPKTQAKTYHGLIAKGPHEGLEPSYANEVWTMMFIKTDNTMLRIERAVLLANMQLTKAEESIYNGGRDQIGNNHDMSIEFNCLPIYGYRVDQAANILLKDITSLRGVIKDSTFNFEKDDSIKDPAVLDSYDYRYGVLGGPSYAPNGKKNSPATIDKLANAITEAEK